MKTSNRSFRNTYAPAAVSGRLGGKEETLRMSESERMATFASSGSSFQAVGLLINPGLASSFPWLSGHAELYDKYRFRKLRFRWIPILSATTSGNVILGFDYDPYDGVPNNSTTMCALSYYSSGSIWDEIVLDIPCKDNIWRFTRGGPVGGDVKTYDFGTLYGSVDGTVAGSVGFIQVDYEIEFAHKNVGLGLGSGNNFNTALFTGDGTINTIPNSGKFIFNLPKLGYSPVGLYNIVTPNASYDTFTLPKGKWLIRAKLQVNNAASSNTAQASGTAVTGTYNSQWQGPGAGFMEVIADSTGSENISFTNTSGSSVLSTGTYCSISFSLLD